MKKLAPGAKRKEGEVVELITYAQVIGQVIHRDLIQHVSQQVNFYLVVQRRTLLVFVGPMVRYLSIWTASFGLNVVILRNFLAVLDRYDVN